MNHYCAFDFACILFMRAMAFEALEEFKDELKDFFLGHELNLIRQFNAQG